MTLPLHNRDLISHNFTESALQTQAANDAVDTLDWFAQRQAAHQFSLRQIPLCELQGWRVDERSGNLVHESGHFFKISGIDVSTNWGNKHHWQQPIIDQPEIGYLGFITKMIEGVLHFLVQAKMEPGNINMIQLAPTLQATRSNFTQVHHGRKPLYLEYFQKHSSHTVLLDVLQSEQGARFLRKRNRNIILKVDEDLPIYPDYCWMPLGQLLEAMQYDNLVNMDARTVLSCIPYAADVLLQSATDNPQYLARSLDESITPRHSREGILSWFTEQKFRYVMEVAPVPLRETKEWIWTGNEIHHAKKLFFSVIACAVEADNREVDSWTQPMVKAAQKGLIAFIVKEWDGVLHFLVQAKVEPGNFDVVEMAPTVQCITGNYKDVPKDRWPPYLEYVLEAEASNVLFDTSQSEEGGRFFREENRNMIVLAESDFDEEDSDRFIWMTLWQLKHFIQYNNFVNVQARCLLSCLNVARGLV